MMAELGEMIDLTQPVWQDRLLDMATMLKPELIVIDSLTSISSAGQNSVEDTNRLLMFLVGLAQALRLRAAGDPPSAQATGRSTELAGDVGARFPRIRAYHSDGAHCAGPDGGPDGRQFSLNGKRRLDMLKRTWACTRRNWHRDAEGRGVGALEYGEPPSFDQESPGDKAESG